MPDQHRIEEIIRRVDDLPAMPDVVAEVLRRTEDPGAAMESVGEAIQMDPALTAKILQVSNSPYFGMKQYVGTLKLALVILGVREVRNIVIGISVFETLSDNGVEAEVAQSIWDKSLHVAGLAKGLGAALSLGFQGEEFIGGLLSDIGKMVFHRKFGGQYAEIYAQFGGEQIALCRAEKMVGGCTHSDVATALATRWNLPQSLCDALWYQYPSQSQPLREAADPQLAAIVRLAKLAVLDDFSGGGPVRCLDNGEAWEALAGVESPMPEADRRAWFEACLARLAEAPRIPL